VHALVDRSTHDAVVVSRDAPQHTGTFPAPVLRSLGPTGRLPARLARAARTAALVSMARRHGVAIVHVHFGYAAHDVLGLVARRHLPLVLSLHGDDVTALPALRPGHYDQLRARVAAVVVPSRWLADRTVELGFDRGVVHVIPSGVDTTRFTPSPVPPGPRVAFVGRLVEKKGLDVLLAAWREVRAAVPDAELLVLGDGPLRDLVAEAVAPGSGVRHLQPDATRRHDQVVELLRDARAVVSPSRTAADGDAESLLLVNLEAQASGRPVVTTRHGGIPEFVAEDRSALVVEPGDPRGLAAALVRALREPGLAERLGVAGPAVAAGFDVAAGAAAVDRLYDALLADRGR
jgi:glycosyltransferase involved in cell wall biosynthesis